MVSRLKGIETQTHYLSYQTQRPSLDMVSRLKGIETSSLFPQLSRSSTLDMVSRLKGIETFAPTRLMAHSLQITLDMVSRLKGIETRQDTETPREQQVQKLWIWFPV